MLIGKREVGLGYPPFIVAELSANHMQSIETALALVESAKNAGVDAVKLQTFTPDTMTLDIHSSEFLIDDEKSLWNGQSLYQLYSKAYLPFKDHRAIFERCRELDLIVFSTPFDQTAVDLLEDLGAPCYKIASLEITDLPLIEAVAKTKKPLILSTGASTLEEIEETVLLAKKYTNDIALLKCTSAYPAKVEDANLKTMQDLANRFNCLVGISDHILGSAASLASVALGGSIIEKHFTLDRSLGGLDAPFSLEPEEMKKLVLEANAVWKSLGSVCYGPLESEKTNYKFRRSIYFVRDLDQGHIISEKDIQSIRPGYGLPPKYFSSLIGKKMARAVKRGKATSWDDLVDVS